MMDNCFSRRHVYYGLLAAAVPPRGFGNARSLSSLGYKSVNEKLNIAAIGTGLRGNQILIGALSPTTLSRCAM